MSAILLDANVLIALTVTEHEHHDPASMWLAGVERFALCPIVEGALVRFLVRVGERGDVTGELVRRVRADARCEFWSDDLSYGDVDLRQVHGHRQVTDTYLVALAASRDGARLATFDRALAEQHPRHCIAVPV